MRITRLEAENFKRLKAVDITPDENTVVIAGRNAQGKSSVLDAIMAALAGKRGAKELVKPIRDGETKARVVVELDDLVVERKWTASGSTVQVSPKGGAARLNSPQAVLDRLIGSLSFDPLAFAEADPKQQVETLIDLIGREEFDALERERREAYDNRTDMNREVKSLRARLNALPATPTGVPPSRVDLGEAMRHLADVEQRIRLRQRWEELQAEIVEMQAEQAALAEAAQSLPDGDPEEIRKQIARADEINKAIDLQEQREDLEGALARAEEASAKHTALIESVDEQRAALIAAADLPVDGLAFDDDGVTYHGVPFVQASAAERLKVSVGMAMALNPELRVICIRDASLLDDDSKRALVALAEEHDYQIWYEVVGSGGEIGVVIEDGQVQS
jgi:DNA repair ATPase RecN